MATATVLPAQTVVIKQGHIVSISASRRTRWPAGTTVVEGRGKYLMPGLIDMHAHLPGKEGTRHSLANYFRLQLAAGVVGLRSMRGDSSHLRWRDSLHRIGAVAPRLYLGTPVFTRDPLYTARRGQQLLKRYQASGYDFAKYLTGLSAAQFDSLLTDARQLNFRVAGHAPAHGLVGAAFARLNSVEHIESIVEAYQRDSVQFRQLATQLAANRIFFCPDEYWYRVTWLQYSAAHLLHLPGLTYVEPRIQLTWQAWLRAKEEQLNPGGIPTPTARQLTSALATYHRAFRVLHRAGVQFLVSPGDGPFIVPGFGVAEELALFVERGLSPYEALRAATVNAAAWFDENGRRGTVEAGQPADLVLLDANPLHDIEAVRRVHGVVLAGRWFPRGALLSDQIKN